MAVADENQTQWPMDMVEVLQEQDPEPALPATTIRNATPYELSRKAFDRYAGTDHPELPEHPVERLQVLLLRWRIAQFGWEPNAHFVLGFVEEVGEAREAFDSLQKVCAHLARATLKEDLGIRGYDEVDKFRALMADGIADALCFLTQLATNIRVDMGTLFEETGTQVMKRDWKTNKQDGG